MEKVVDTNTHLKSHNLLSALVHYLTDNYGDDLWDSTTRELLEEANDHLGFPKIEWCVNEEFDTYEEVLNEH